MYLIPFVFTFFLSIIGNLYLVEVVSARSSGDSNHGLVAASDKPSMAKGFTMSPVRNEIGIAPGVTYAGTLKLTNQTDKPMDVSMSAEKFGVVNQEYDYAFSSTSYIVQWVRFDQPKLTLGAGETRKVSYTIGVPIKSEPGGQYISLFATSDAQEGDQSINAKQRIASLVYVTVDGRITRAGKLLTLDAPWLVDAASTYSMTLQNSGTTHFRSHYSVRVEDLLGHTVVQHSGTSLVLPGSVRLVSDKLPVPTAPGLYKAVYSIGLGDTPNTYQARYIVYLPAWSLAAFAVLAAMAVMTFFYVRSILGDKRKDKKS